MAAQLNLKELERKAFRSMHQDGLWDMQWGLIVICMAFFLFRPDDGYGPQNIILMVVAISLVNLIVWVGKMFVTAPRMGQVSFGPLRKQKYKTLAIILGAIILVQAFFVLLTGAGWLNASFGAKLSAFLGVASLGRMLVAVLASLFVAPALILIAFFSDFPRGYYIAILAAMAVFLMILLNQPIYPILIGALILVPGAVLFVRFLRKYPLHHDGLDHE